jgi:hypothetical protein
LRLAKAVLAVGESGGQQRQGGYLDVLIMLNYSVFILLSEQNLLPLHNICTLLIISKEKRYEDFSH